MLFVFIGRSFKIFMCSRTGTPFTFTDFALSYRPDPRKAFWKAIVFAGRLIISLGTPVAEPPGEARKFLEQGNVLNPHLDLPLP
ncbi:MAG: hypothetical protein COZ70_01435 [Deltaproteobacteria bacterium CG_4_8_14_3_um_filter_51_11]|nr:MAG: hypothetical protein COX16_07825 [Deltaproteobacteria bacterium CG23_combo_of_CG06-09_8_20_14_all_51_20]PIX20838.1 MAG: hypothetical protein COZ70_01435 [Deltaproteobacteria bacterium CG_4_8_14_3_um_filter_51_11]